MESSLDMLGAEFLASAVPIVGALPAYGDLRPYFLDFDTLPKTREGLSQIYAAYLKSYDAFVDSIHSVWHPVDTNAVLAALYGARSVATDKWSSDKLSDNIFAVQLLAGLMGYFNHQYVKDDATVDWQALNTPVNASLIEGSQAVAQSVVDTAKAAGKFVEKVEKGLSTVWWVAIVGGSVALVGLGLLLWRLLKSDVAKQIVVRRLGGR